MNNTAVSLDELSFELADTNAQNKHVELIYNVSNTVMSAEANESYENEERDSVILSGNKLQQTAVSEFEDCKTDVAPHLLFTSSKNIESDDSDAEFIIPERSISLFVENQNHPEVLIAEISTAAKQSDDSKELNRTLLNTFHPQPEVLISQEQLTSNDLSNSIFPTSHGIETSVISDANKSHVVIENSLLTTRSLSITLNKEAQEQNQLQKPQIVTTAEDWEDVQTVEPGIFNPKEGIAAPVSDFESKPLITYTEAWSHFELCNYSNVKGQIKTSIERHGFTAFIHLIFGPPKLHKELLPERDIVFCIAATPFQNENPIHHQVLQAIYRCLTGSKFECQRHGSHWEEIGFQGCDPATDLRGAGMLALLHILYFLRDPKTKELAREIYKLSLHPTQNFPFCVMGINLSRICLQVLREEVFNKECNKHKDVMGTINEVYASLFLYLYNLWKRGKTIADSGFVLQELEIYSRKHSKTIFKDFETSEKMRKQKTSMGNSPSTEPTFFSVCKKEDGDEKSPAELY